MAINPYFDLYSGVGNANEQKLLSDLGSECIQTAGMDFIYMPRSFQKEDGVFHEDVVSSFNTTYTIEMYVESYQGVERDDIIAAFGLQTNDELILKISSARFKEETTLARPNEGDLIKLPLSNQLFEIKYTEPETVYYTLGSLPFFEIKCQLFEYSHETMNTGISSIDAIETNVTLSNDADLFESEASTIIDWTENNPFGNSAG